MIDEKKLIKDLKAWQMQLRANEDVFADIVDTMMDVVISKIEGQPKVIQMTEFPIPLSPFLEKEYKEMTEWQK